MLFLFQGTEAQTIFDWLNAAPDGNFKQGLAGDRWYDNSLLVNLQDEPTGSGIILRFNNNGQLSLNNNVTGFSIHRLLFDVSSTSSRSLGGNTLTMVPYAGTNARIDNQSAGAHIITFGINGDAGAPLELKPVGGNLTINGSIDNMGSPVWITGTGNKTLAIGGGISGAGTFEVKNNTVVILSGANTYTVSTYISGSGNLQFTSDANLGNGGDVYINAGTLSHTSGTTSSSRNFYIGPSSGSGTATIAASGNFTINGLVSNNGSGSGGILKIGTGTLTLANTSNSFTGTVYVSNGTLSIPAESALGGGTSITLESNTVLSVTGGAGTGTKTYYLGSSSGVGSATINIVSSDYTITGAISNNGSGSSSLIKTGAGTLIFDGVVKNYGNIGTSTTINGGVIRIAGTNNCMPTYINLVMANTAGVGFDLNGFNQQLLSISGGGTTGGAITLGGGSLTLTGSSATTFSGSISGAGNFINTGSGSITLAGTNTYTGSTTINTGTIVFNTAAALPSGSNINLLNNASFSIGAANTTAVNAGILTISSGGIIDLGTGSNGYDLTFSNSGPVFSGTLTIQNWTYGGGKRIYFADATHIGTVLTQISFEGYGTGAAFNGATNEIIPASLYFTVAGPGSGNFSSTASWQGGVVPPANSNIVVRSGFTLTLDGSYSLKSIDVSSGAVFSCTAANTLTLGSAAAGYSKFSNNGTATFTDGTIVFGSAGGYIDGTTATTINNLTSSGPVRFKRAPAVNGLLLVNSGSAFTGSAPNYGTSSTLQYATGGTYQRNVEWNNHTTGAGYPNHILISGTTEVRTDLYPVTVSTNDKIGLRGNLTIEAGSHLNHKNKWYLFYIGGNLSVDGTLSLSGGTSPGADMYLNGNWYRGAAGVIDYNYATLSRWVYLQGSSSVTISRPSGYSEAIPQLVLSKPIGGYNTITLNCPLNIYSVLSFQAGGIIVSTTANMLSISDRVAIQGTPGTASFISGPVLKVGRAFNTTQPFTFPIGKIVGSEYHYRPFIISAPANSTTQYTIEFQRSNPYLQGPISAAAVAAGLSHISNCEYWDFTAGPASPPVDVTLSWSNNPLGRSKCNTGAYVNDVNYLVVAPYYNGEWGDQNSPYFGRSSTSGSANPVVSPFLSYITWNAPTGAGPYDIDSYKKFVLASTDWRYNPLPFDLSVFAAREKNGVVDINWSVLQNQLFESYAVETSADGIHFKSFTVQQADALQTAASYSAVHVQPVQGWNYYRLVATDYMGQHFVSAVVRVWLKSKTGGEPSILSNPVTGNSVQIDPGNLARGKYRVQLLGADGKIFGEVVTEITASGLPFTLPVRVGFPKGMFVVRMISDRGNVIQLKGVKL